MTTPARGEADYLSLGDWNAVCFDCGKKRKASELVKTWQNFYVCPHHVNIVRHPQDFVRGIPDNMSVPWSQSTPAPIFTHFCTPNGLSAVPGFAEPGCAVPSYISPSYNPLGPD